MWAILIRASDKARVHIFTARAQHSKVLGKTTKKYKGSWYCSMGISSKENSRITQDIMACTGTKMEILTKAHGKTMLSRASAN